MRMRLGLTLTKYVLRGLLLLLLLVGARSAAAGVQLEAVYPYHLDQREAQVVQGGSTLPLYINIKSFDVPVEQKVRLRVQLPAGFTLLPNAKWRTEQDGEGLTAVSDWLLPADFGQSFDLLYLVSPPGAERGTRQLRLEVAGPDWRQERQLTFSYEPEQAGAASQSAAAPGNKPDRSKFNWYIQSVTLPVDNLGNRDDRAAEGVLYIRDTALEGFRSRMTGDGATNWSAVFNHPATFVLLELRNPQQDVQLLRFRAELVDKLTGAWQPGLCTAGKNNENSENGWAGEVGSSEATTALLSLDGKKAQSFIIPLYVDYFSVLEGDYSLRVTVSGNGQEKVQEVPLTIAKRHNLGAAAVGFAGLCSLVVLLSLRRLRRCIGQLGARGAITVALFAALAFGGITLPTTLLGDVLHVLLGPFAGFVTGLLSGVLQYLLVMALLVLFRVPGVLALMYLLKYLLAGLMFGHFTPLGFLSVCVNIAVLELVLQLCGFYRRRELTVGYLLLVSLLLGVGDAVVTLVNMEQLMFFYRLYYADWYLALYMLINGLLYSSVGAWLGARTGAKLQQVMGE